MEDNLNFLTLPQWHPGVASSLFMLMTGTEDGQPGHDREQSCHNDRKPGHDGVQPGQHRETALHVNDKTEHRYDGSQVTTMR